VKESIDKVRRALSRQGIVDRLTYYLVKDGFVCASDGRMTAGAPFPSNLTFLVPGGEFEKVVDHLQGNTTELTLLDGKLLLKSGRLRATIETLPLDQAFYPHPEGAWLPPPDGLVEALRRVRPFVSDNATRPWALCVSLRTGAIMATTNVALVEVACPALLCDELLLPCWAVDFILFHPAKLTGVIFQQNNACFQWDDKSWMVSQLGEGKFPEVCSGMLDNGEDPTWEIPQEWRDALIGISKLCSGEILCGAVSMVGKTEKSVVEYEVTSPAEASKWEQRYLTTVVQAATHLALTSWPKPARFKGTGIRGVIAGRV
jgi:hypothetical protein